MIGTWSQTQVVKQREIKSSLMFVSLTVYALLPCERYRRGLSPCAQSPAMEHVNLHTSHTGCLFSQFPNSSDFSPPAHWTHYSKCPRTPTCAEVGPSLPGFAWRAFCNLVFFSFFKCSSTLQQIQLSPNLTNHNNPTDITIWLLQQNSRPPPNLLAQIPNRFLIPPLITSSIFLTA